MLHKPLPALVAALVLLLPAFASAAGPDDPAGDEQLLKAAAVANGPALLESFRRATLNGAEQERIQALIRQLGDEEYEKREKASAELLTLGGTAVPKLREAVKSRDPEVAFRA